MSSAPKGVDTAGCPSPLMLERLAAGEMPETAPERLHAADCDRCLAHLRDLKNDDAAFTLDPAVARIRGRLLTRRGSRVRTRWTLPRVSWAVAALPLMVVALLLLKPVAQLPEDRWSAKGGDEAKTEVEVIVERGGRQSVWRGAAVEPTDSVQTLFGSTRPQHLAVFARSRGEVMQLFPVHGDQAGSVGPGALRPVGDRASPSELALDLEILVFSSAEPFSLEPIRAQLRGTQGFDETRIARGVRVARVAAPSAPER